MSNFSCQYCKKQFGANCALRRHVRQFHEGAPLPEVRRGRKPKSDVGLSLVNFENSVEKKEMSNFTIGPSGLPLPEVRRARQTKSDVSLVDFENSVEKKEMSNFTSGL